MVGRMNVNRIKEEMNEKKKEEMNEKKKVEMFKKMKDIMQDLYNLGWYDAIDPIYDSFELAKEDMMIDEMFGDGMMRKIFEKEGVEKC